MSKLQKRYEQMTQGGGVDGYSNFAGDDSDYRHWFAAPLGRSRDSSVLEESNFAKGVERLGGESDDVMVARYGHWAVGWVEQVYVRPGSDAVAIAEEIHDKLESHPVLDEDDYSERCMEEANKVWSGCFDDKGRIEYIREHRHDFEFHDFADLRACVKGEFFSGDTMSIAEGC
jgi:hypothetical protein